MSKCSAPGKFILFGEHAVVFGKPAIAIAIDRRITTSVRRADEFMVNGYMMTRRHHAYISAALDQAWNGPPVAIDTVSEIPPGSGLGSSAAVSVSCVGALLSEKNGLDAERIARKAFEVECVVQGRASPTDTSTSAHGHGVLVSPERLDGFLWKVEKGERVWNIHHCDIPELTFVVGHTGIHAGTGPLVAKVNELVDGSGDARRAIDRIGELVLEGVESLRARDKAALGRLMTENHDLLNGLGVGHPALESLVEACTGRCYGAKMTGAGGGGSMIALTDDPVPVSDAITSAGGHAIIVKVGAEGVRAENA